MQLTWIIFCGVAKVKRYVYVYLHLCRQQPEMDNQNVGFAFSGKNFADAHACVICVYNLTSALYFAIWPFSCYSSTLCSSLSVSVSLNVRFTKNGVCSKTYNHIHVVRTNEDLSPYICNVCEFLGTNYCMPTRWLTGSLQKIPRPWLTRLVTPPTVGGRHFSTRPEAALAHVGSLTINKLQIYSFESFTLSPFEKILGSWYPEFVHIHVFIGIHETINNKQEDLKH